MQNKKRRGSLPAAIAAVLLPAVLLFWGHGLEGAALLGTGLAIPGGGIAVLLHEDEPNEPDNIAEVSAPEISTSAPEPSQAPQESSVAQTIPTANEQAKAPDSAVSAKAPNLADTPADIAALAAKVEAAAKGSKLGAVIEGDYSKAGATNVFGSVRVKNTTETKSVDIKAELAKKPDIAVKNKKKPAVLIFHTHTTESYALFERDFYTAEDTGRSKDPARNMVRVGDEIAAQLEQAGYGVIHDTTIHDTSYNGSYSRSAVSIRKHLDEHPEIQVILDIHRDAIHTGNSRQKPVAKINGKKAAQLMIVTGAEEGTITNFANWKSNLTFALHLQKAIVDSYPGLARPVFFCQRVYNMDMGKNNLLVEVGTDANTLDEAAYSGRLLGRALAAVIGG
ncbi:MAG: stage II sporulation protein P [Oscillospiraceae bacterium]|jgi:stage II sporulation protein P|nr:stage II sporulation protein P [Oscillospiraceae bacterium]